MSRRHKHKTRDLHIQRRTDPGAAPGTITADPSQPKPEVTVIAYSGDKCHQETLTDPSYRRQVVIARCSLMLDGPQTLRQILGNVGRIFQADR